MYRFLTLAALTLCLMPGAAPAQPSPPERIFADPVGFDAQLAAAGPGEIVLINTFRVPAGQEEAFLRAWTRAAAVLGRQPGLLRATMHRGVGGSLQWVNVATWRSAADLRAGLGQPDFVAAARGIGVPFYRQIFTVAAAQ